MFSKQAFWSSFLSFVVTTYRKIHSYVPLWVQETRRSTKLPQLPPASTSKLVPPLWNECSASILRETQFCNGHFIFTKIIRRAEDRFRRCQETFAELHLASEIPVLAFLHG